MKKQHIKLTETDERYLTTLLSKGQLPARVFRRASALLQLHQGASFQTVAQTFQIVPQTVSRWRTAYLEIGLEFLDDRQRAGRPPLFDGAARAKLTALACSAAPAGRAKWSLRLLADKAVELDLCQRISHSQIGVILKKINYSRI
ncbi:MAG: helix-turn-helix domain-containing protein [Pyrinomonadaceae bacterium]